MTIMKKRKFTLDCLSEDKKNEFLQAIKNKDDKICYYPETIDKTAIIIKIDKKIESDAIKKKLKEFGQILHLKIPTTKNKVDIAGYALVSYENPENLDKLMQNFNKLDFGKDSEIRQTEGIKNREMHKLYVKMQREYQKKLRIENNIPQKDDNKNGEDINTESINAKNRILGDKIEDKQKMDTVTDTLVKDKRDLDLRKTKKNCYVLRVSNFSPSTYMYDFKRFLNTQGNMSAIRVMQDKQTGKNRGVAYLNFYNKDDAVDFLKKKIDYQNRRLIVEEAKESYEFQHYLPKKHRLDSHSNKEGLADKYSDYNFCDKKIKKTKYDNTNSHINNENCKNFNNSSKLSCEMNKTTSSINKENNIDRRNDFTGNTKNDKYKLNKDNRDEKNTSTVNKNNEEYNEKHENNRSSRLESIKSERTQDSKKLKSADYKKTTVYSKIQNSGSFSACNSLVSTEVDPKIHKQKRFIRVPHKIIPTFNNQSTNDIIDQLDYEFEVENTEINISRAKLDRSPRKSQSNYIDKKQKNNR